MVRKFSDTFLSVTAYAILDMSGNEVAAIKEGSALACNTGEFSEDRTSPKLENFKLDMDGSPTLTLTFSETMDASTIKAFQFTLQSEKVHSAFIYKDVDSFSVLGSGSGLPLDPNSASIDGFHHLLDGEF